MVGMKSEPSSQLYSLAIENQPPKIIFNVAFSSLDEQSDLWPGIEELQENRETLTAIDVLLTTGHNVRCFIGHILQYIFVNRKLLF